MEELPGLGAEAVEAHAADLEGDDARRLGHDPADVQPVAPGDGDRQRHAQADEGGQGEHVEADPRRPRDGLVLELVPRGELVGEGQRHGDVGEQVDAVPGPVRQAPAHDGRRRGHHHEQQHEAARRREHPRVVAEQRPQLGDGADPVLEGVPRRDERRVGEDEGQHGDPAHAVGAGDAPGAERPVDERDAGEQQHLDEREVAAGHPGHPAEARQQPGRVVHLAHAALAPPEADGEGQPGRGEHAEVPAGGRPPGAGRGARDGGDGGWSTARGGRPQPPAGASAGARRLSPGRPRTPAPPPRSPRPPGRTTRSRARRG